MLMYTVPPTIDTAVSSYDMTVNEGEEVELTCNATGRPTPSVMWMRQGNALLPIGLERVMVSELKHRIQEKELQGSNFGVIV